MSNEEPTRSHLAAIDAEWPVIAAELEVTDAECRLAASPIDVLAVRAHRRAVRRLLAVRTTTATVSATGSSRSAACTVPSAAPAVPVAAA